MVEVTMERLSEAEGRDEIRERDCESGGKDEVREHSYLIRKRMELLFE
jgi:hypothetical protein